MLCLPSSLSPAMASATVPNSKLKLLASTAVISHRAISGTRSPPASILAVQLAIHRYPRLVVSRATDDGAGSVGADQVMYMVRPTVFMALMSRTILDLFELIPDY